MSHHCQICGTSIDLYLDGDLCPKCWEDEDPYLEVPDDIDTPAIVIDGTWVPLSRLPKLGRRANRDRGIVR
jgi:hypothetical protein